MEALLLVILLVCFGGVLSERGSACTTPNGEAATCTAFNSCKIIKDSVFEKNKDAIEFAKMSQCGYDSEPLVCCGSTALKTRDSCVTPNGEIAKCVPLDSCEVIKDALTTLNSNAFLFAKQSRCVGDPVKVCCGSTGYTNSIFRSNLGVDEVQEMTLEYYDIPELPDRTICGFHNATERIWGGELTELNEFPWMAALEYKSKLTEQTAGIRCGGSIINDRYIVTAAHCLYHVEFELIGVRLGEWRLSTDPDCDMEDNTMECGAKVQKFKIEKKIQHNSYSRKGGASDIGLLKVDRDITYNEYIRPICLAPQALPSPQFGTKVTVAGWGLTENETESDVKLKVKIPILLNEDCIEKLGSIDDNQLCAGGEKGKDSCRGDSGGPLMKDYKDDRGQTQWFLEGVVARGWGCGQAGYPAIYTRVASHMDWILNIIVRKARGSACITPNGEAATCTAVRSCKIITDAVVSGNKDAIEFAKMSQCGFDTEPLVCCGSTALRNETHQSPLLPNRTVCGIQASENRIIGGTIADLDEHPWMVLLRYKHINRTDAGFKCGGTLINNRYVLTAAHCIISREYDLYSVRLGEWKISTIRDCEESTFNEQCADPVIDLYIEQMIPNNQYERRSGKNDIALIRLKRNVEYSEFVRPICLPHQNSAIPAPGTTLYAAGWGKTENGTSSDVKLKVNLPVVAKSDCVAKVSRNRPVTDDHICAGGEFAKDACSQDSGGPLMAALENHGGEPRQWYQEGIVSWGIGCGIKGYPGVYTRVSKYINWIQENLSEF